MKIIHPTYGWSSLSWQESKIRLELENMDNKQKEKFMELKRNFDIHFTTTNEEEDKALVDFVYGVFQLGWECGVEHHRKSVVEILGKSHDELHNIVKRRSFD
jgi:hypothetical protein